MPDATAHSTTLHASTIAHAGHGLLILGPSGAGKSTLALRMISLGARLVADDQTLVMRHGDALRARCPLPRLAGVIELRGLGLLRAPHLPEVTLALAIDLGQEEPARLPPNRKLDVLGCALPLVLRPQNDHLAEGLLLWLAEGRLDPDNA